MGIEVRDDTVVTTPMPAGSWVIGGQSASDAAPTAFGRESIFNYVSSALASVASSGSATDLTSGTLPLQRLHAHLIDIASIAAPAQGEILHFNGSDFVTLAPGSAGQFLKTNGTGADVVWATPAGAGDLLSVNNLNDLGNAATARTNLGVAIGTDVQAYDAQLADIAALAVTDGNVIVGNGTNWVAESGATARTSLGLAIGTDVQAYSSVLANTTASFLTAQETKLGHISVTQAVDLDAIETRVNALDAAVVLIGGWDASAGTFPGGGTAQAGASYIVTVAGTVDGVAFSINDRLLSYLDNASTTTYAANWLKLDYTDQVLSVAGRTGAVTIAVADVTDMSANGRSLTSAADYAAMKALLDLEIGTDVQAQDAELSALAGLTSAADKVPYFTGAGTASTADFTASGRAMVATASAAAQTALLSAFTGDSGSGGVKGLVPAPAAGDAAASKFLKADGSWVAPSGSGDVVGPASATDGRATLFDGATGKLIKALTATGIIKAASGVLSAASVGPDYGSAPINLRIAASVATNAMTIALKDLAGSDPSSSSPVLIPTATISASAAYSTWGSVTGALSVVIPSGTTIGTASAVASPVYVYAINNAGTIELAVSLKYHGPSGTVTTVAISGGATSTVMYSTTARTTVGFTCLGVVYQSQTTAGTWAAAPSSVETAPFQLKQYAWSAYLGTNQTGILSTVETQINFDTENYDADGMYSTSTYKATIQEPGIYDVRASVGSNSGYQAICRVMKNSGTAILTAPPCTGFLGPTAGSGRFQLVPGDTVYVVFYQGTGTDAAYGNSTWTFFAGGIVR